MLLRFSTNMIKLLRNDFKKVKISYNTKLRLASVLSYLLGPNREKNNGPAKQILVHVFLASCNL